MATSARIATITKFPSGREHLDRFQDQMMAVCNPILTSQIIGGATDRRPVALYRIHSTDAEFNRVQDAVIAQLNPFFRDQGPVVSLKFPRVRTLTKVETADPVLSRIQDEWIAKLNPVLRAQA
jgi:hypothetical protein